MLEPLLVKPGHDARLRHRDPGDRLGLHQEVDLADEVAELFGLQDRLWAEARRSVLVVLQGMDASGKDGTIRHVFTGLNPHGCRVTDFKEPSATDLAQDYLWRVHACCPARGQIGIWNRSHYEDVIATRVRGLVSEHVWHRRYRHLREFERLLTDEGTTLVKVFLHISFEEQGRRFQERADTPHKRWKLRQSDLDDRRRWDEYVDAYERAITETSTDWAPWHVIPADQKWVRNAAVMRLLLHVMREMKPQFPEPPPPTAS
jgi:PPK2 family polyphosphate:nucleotide phosphotransferase